MVKEGTGEVSWLKEGCYSVRDKICKRNKSLLRVKASIEGRLCISTTVKVEKCKKLALPTLASSLYVTFYYKVFPDKWF